MPTPRHPQQSAQQHAPGSEYEAKQIIEQASLMLAAFRRKLNDAGYPFKEPAGLTALLVRCDSYLFPEFGTVQQRETTL